MALAGRVTVGVLSPQFTVTLPPSPPAETGRKSATGAPGLASWKTTSDSGLACGVPSVATRLNGAETTRSGASATVVVPLTLVLTRPVVAPPSVSQIVTVIDLAPSSA